MAPLDRRTFLSAGAGTALLCSIGGTKIALSKPGDAAVADLAAAKVKKPASAKLPIDTAEFPRPKAAPGGVEREYWIQARTIPWDIAPTGRDEWHGAPITGKHAFRAFVYQLMTRRLRRRRRPGPDARPDAARRGRRPARRPRAQRRSPPQPGDHHAPARGPLQPELRRLLHGRLHAPGRLHRARRGVHLHLGGDAGLGRRVALPRPRAQPHAQHVSRPLRRDRDPREGGQGARRRAGPLPPQL